MKNKLSISIALIACGVLLGCSEDTIPNVNSCTSSDECNVDGKSGYTCRDGRCICTTGSCTNSNDPDPTKPDPTKPDPTKPDPTKPDPTKPDPTKPDPSKQDSDNDTIPDEYDSCEVDTDGDGKFDCADDDSDGDTIPDAIEGQVSNGEPMDTDGDGIYDFLDKDSDDNGIPDAKEIGSDPTHPVDTDNDTVPDYLDFDNDGDGIDDIDEIAGIEADGHPGKRCGEMWCTAGTPENPWDSDNNGIPDYNDPDNDGDGIPDSVEGTVDTNEDGELDIYSLDSNGDGIPDSAGVGPDGSLISYTDPETGKTTYCYQSKDCDGDALLDALELTCDGQSTALNADFDNDGYIDGAEYAAAQYAMQHGLLNGSKINSPADLVCNPNLGVKDVFEFFFILPYGGEKQDDDLPFYPEVKKLDLVFNVDTTGSMTTAVNNVKNNIGNVITSIQGMVKDSGFALTNFDDYPVVCVWEENVTITSNGQTLASNVPIYYPCGVPEAGDLPFRVLGNISTDPATVTKYTQNPQFTIRHGADGAESGVEALYQIATGSGTSWTAGTQSGWFYAGNGSVEQTSWSWPAGNIPPHQNAPGTWGGVDFRNGSLPIVIHTTDVYAHDKQDAQYLSYYPSYMSYLPNVMTPHYSTDLIPLLKNKGIRVITLSVPNQQGTYGADELGQMTLWSRESKAIVPACAFEGACGQNQCCLGSKTVPAQTIDGHDNQCILTYQAAQSDVSATIVKGVDAIVKYGTYDVATKIRGEAIADASVDTSCFVKQVMATQYIAPPQEPEKSCNPVAIPNAVGGSDYNNGFTNFAPGTSSADRKGAELHFTVYAQNDTCIPPANESQVFTAYIEVYDPVTGLSFGERKVSIIVPPGGNEVN